MAPLCHVPLCCLRATASIDVACKFRPWLDRVSAKADRVQNGLRLAARKAREKQAPLRQLLRDAADGSSAATWLQTTLTSLATDFKTKSNTDDDASREVALVMGAFVYILEVHGGIDVEVDDEAAWPDVSLRSYPIVLDAMHAFAHGNTCRLRFDPRGVDQAGRQCGEQVERWNAVVMAFLARVAKAGTEETKSIVAAVMRGQQDAKMLGAAKVHPRLHVDQLPSPSPRNKIKLGQPCFAGANVVVYDFTSMLFPVLFSRRYVCPCFTRGGCLAIWRWTARSELPNCTPPRAQLPRLSSAPCAKSFRMTPSAAQVLWKTPRCGLRRTPH